MNASIFQAAVVRTDEIYNKAKAYEAEYEAVSLILYLKQTNISDIIN